MDMDVTCPECEDIMGIVADRAGWGITKYQCRCGAIVTVDHDALHASVAKLTIDQVRSIKVFMRTFPDAVFAMMEWRSGGSISRLKRATDRIVVGFVAGGNAIRQWDDQKKREKK